MKLSVVCYLDDAATAAMRSTQKSLSDLTGAKASLDLWLPHVTVGYGVEVNEVELAKVQEKFGNLTRIWKPFSVTLQDILKIDSRKGGEEEETTPYGLYLDVKSNKELLSLVSDSAQITKEFNKWYFMPCPYQPHCALAFKDLSEDGYKLGSEYLDKQNIQIQARVTSVSIVEMLPDETKEYTRFNFAV